MESPFISFCIPTYNRAHIVEGCVKEILKCNEQDIEVVVCDNCSEDNTLELLNKINDKRLKIYTNEENMGYNYNLIKVCDVAVGEYLFLLSDEDRIMYEKIKDLKDFLNRNDYSVLTTVLTRKKSGEKLSLSERFKLPLKYIYNERRNLSVLSKVYKFLGRGYVGGIILKKNSLDFQKIKDKELDYYLLYPQAYMSLMASNVGSSRVYGKSYIFVVDFSNYSFIFDEKNITGFHYAHPVSRKNEFEKKYYWICEFPYTNHQKKLLLYKLYKKGIVKSVKGYYFVLSNKYNKEFFKFNYKIRKLKMKIFINLVKIKYADEYFEYLKMTSEEFLKMFDFEIGKE